MRLAPRTCRLTYTAGTVGSGPRTERSSRVKHRKKRSDIEDISDTLAGFVPWHMSHFLADLDEESGSWPAAGVLESNEVRKIRKRDKHEITRGHDFHRIRSPQGALAQSQRLKREFLTSSLRGCMTFPSPTSDRAGNCSSC